MTIEVNYHQSRCRCIQSSTCIKAMLGGIMKLEWEIWMIVENQVRKETTPSYYPTRLAYENAVLDMTQWRLTGHLGPKAGGLRILRSDELGLGSPAEWIQRIQRESGLSGHTLASAVGVCQSSLSLYASGKKLPINATIRKIEKALYETNSRGAESAGA